MLVTWKLKKEKEMFELKCKWDSYESLKYNAIVKQMRSLYLSIKQEKSIFEWSWNIIWEWAIIRSTLDL